MNFLTRLGIEEVEETLTSDKEIDIYRERKRERNNRRL